MTGYGDNENSKREDERNKEGIFENCSPFTACISEINKTQIDNAKGIDLLMPM